MEMRSGPKVSGRNRRLAIWPRSGVVVKRGSTVYYYGGHASIEKKIGRGGGKGKEKNKREKELESLVRLEPELRR